MSFGIALRSLGALRRGTFLPAVLSGQWMPAQREDKSTRDQERADGRKHDTDFHDFVFGDHVRGKILEHFQELARARRRVIGSISHVGNLLQRRLINHPAEPASKLLASSRLLIAPAEETPAAKLIEPVRGAKPDG